MPRSSLTTRTRLITAAEELFAERGIDAVSLREINRASGARNAVAVQYHFEDRAGVIRAILDKHRGAVDAARHLMLDGYEQAGRPDLRGLAEALVVPSATKLADLDGGPAYLQINSELVNRPQAGSVDSGSSDSRDSGSSDSRDSIRRWRSLVEPLLDPEATRLHRRFTAIRFSAAELGRRAASGPHTDDRLFISHLVDLVTAILVAPVSEQTVRLADDRDTSLGVSSRATRRPEAVEPS
ncbi:MAG: hypothetical protein AVDCRST_MAG50-186 [uncultured Acidimicrobiales bacterium]|uniref:HTH tetR-type domain-containing protein n=1 Tax=uncultured Acidimicrobiales bacterium TaxID=310071 RepID=A0A6J4H6D7_9ACTN|nr:MAG: hypothetical protein AVDCRST_MAG50-186 [uncultured Acidimicrobiales bacterium]